MSAIEELERVDNTKFDEKAFVDFLESIGGRSGWDEGGRWELIDGIPIDMPPTTLRHGAIARVFERLLASALSQNGLPLDATREVGLSHPNDPMFRPVADVVVFDPQEEISAGGDRFLKSCQLVAEVLSPSTEHIDLLFKRRRYTELPNCLLVMIIEQDRMRVRHWARQKDWAETVYEDPEGVIDLPQFGFSCALRDLYARTDLV
ncbi:Uma2 family endonuclease [Jiella marina]|uniref:Uma2 family endonuclease n=1 Tax=Jiella sp. LLJ827 TaxID=2917712 RepID=UPI0021008AF9|nr:Uma2 family endonuclease [Jiella sp. LLJ827]MCQ0987248.1 Uma2 family endonuclease [Jiella sp. LLJ827]